MTHDQLAYLLRGYNEGTLSTQEQQELYNFLDDIQAGEVPSALVQEWLDQRESVARVNGQEEMMDRHLRKIFGFDKDLSYSAASDHEGSRESGPVVHRLHRLKTAWLKYAAAIFILVTGVTLYYQFSGTNISDNPVAVSVPPEKGKDVLPGYNRAVLTLSTGQQVELDSAAFETIIDQTLSIENSNGHLTYTEGGVMAMNTMSTPRGGQYQLTLADGTKVWLNAASSITYPTAFAGKTRAVKLTGEAYFEVAKNKAMPFVVNVDDKSLVQVLGTSFNINSYPNEQNIRTTLIEGSVKVSRETTISVGESTEHKPESYVILKPGQQARVAATITVETDPDLSQTLAWKNGLFSFHNSDLVSVMKQLERWYDIQVKYEGNVSDLTFRGEMYRNVNLSTVLDFLTKMGINVRMEGTTLIVSEATANNVK